MIIVNDLRAGMSIQENGELFIVLDKSDNKTARSQMIIKVKVRNMRTGTITELTYNGGNKVKSAHIDKKEMQYLYDAGNALALMDNTTYEQIEIPKENLEWELNFLKENDNVEVVMFQGEILGVNLPEKVELEIVESEPAVRGDTARNALKDATLETGLKIRVPLFIDKGERVIVRTDDGSYDSRA